MSAEHEAIHFLLGDLKREPRPRIEEWVAAAETQWLRHVEQSLSDVQTLLRRHPSLVSFNLAAALFHDAQLLRATVSFRSIAAEPSTGEPLKVLALVGQARAVNSLRRYENAAHMLQRAYEQSLRRAAASADAALECAPALALVRFLRIINLSDWGEKIDDTEALELSLPDMPDRLAILLDSLQAYAYARVRLRSGQPREGIARLERSIGDPRFEQLGEIPRATVVRMCGILRACSGQPSGARADLEEALAAYRTAGHQLGEVQATFSLARMSASVDRDQTYQYLMRAKAILEKTDLPHLQRANGRQMPAERTALLSRLADFEFARGDFNKALAMYSQDLQQIEKLAGNDVRRLPREAAYAERSIGRTLLALGRPGDAAEEFKRSADLFREVDDPMNIFFSSALDCEARMETRAFADAAALLAKLEKILASRPTRQKERAIVDTLQGRYLWQCHSDPESALDKLSRAKFTLRQHGRDYYYIRALVMEAEVLEGTRDLIGARHVLVEARRCALSQELEDVRQSIESHLRRLGVGPHQFRAMEQADLVRRCEDEGFIPIEATILFADLRGFSAACMEVDPTAMAQFIAAFAQRVSRCTSRFEGMPVRFLGDCVMALFGVHDSAAPKERLAVSAAAEMYQLFGQLRERWSHMPRIKPLGLGFGLATGRVVAGHFGSEDLREFSVIGEVVNLASRLQGVSENGEIVVCRETARVLELGMPRLPSAGRTVDLKGFGMVPAQVIRVRDALDLLRRTEGAA